MNKEIWKDIEGYEGLYQVSNQGNVRSLERIDSLGRLVKGKILKPWISKNGYIMIKLGRSHRHLLVHRLVAIAFIPNPYNKPQVDHINGDRSNNSVSNLRWVTQTENNLNPITHRKMSESKKGENHPMYGKHHSDETKKKTSKSVIQKSINGEIIREWFGQSEAAHTLGIDSSNISRCCSGRLKTYKGFIWENKY